MEQPGQVVKTTTTREVLPTTPGKERSTPEFWDYLEKLKLADWDRHILYIYRVEDGRNVPLEKCVGSLATPDNRQVPIGDKEELELAIAHKYGGRCFRLILKRGSERVTETRVYVDLPPKMVAPANFEASGVQVVSEASATADVAKAAMNTMATQDKQGIEIATNVVRTMGDMVQQMAKAPQPVQDDLTKQVMAVLIQRALNPPDPIETFTKLMAVIPHASGTTAPAANPASPIVDKILNTALEKLLNPTAPVGPGPVSTGAELVRQLPSVASYVTQAFTEWRLGMEAQRDTMAIARGVNGRPSQPAQPGRATLPPAQPPAVNPSEAQAMGVPSLEFIEAKIVEILKEAPSAEEAADEAMSFLQRMDPQLVTQLVAAGEPGLLHLFNTRPVLKQATVNVPKLQEFIRAFLKYAAEDAAGQGESKPN